MTLAFLPRLQNSAKLQRSLSPIVISIALIIIGAGSFWLYHWARDLHRFIQGISGYTALFITQFAIYLLACYVATQRQSPMTRTTKLILASIVFIFAAAFRFDLVAQKPYLSTDVYRYVWDGRVQARGLNPYRFAPSAPELEALRDDKIYPNINRSDFVRTPYPPVAQMIFFAAYLLNQSSVTGFKALITLFDLLAIVALMMALARVGLAPVHAIIFAWHPLLIYESAHTGHIDSGFIVFLALALLARSYQKNALTGVALALATLVKFYPVLLLPAFLYAKEKRATDEQRFPRGSTSEPRLEYRLQAESFLFTKFRLKAVLQTLLTKANITILLAFAITIALAYLPYLSVGGGRVRFALKRSQRRRVYRQRLALFLAGICKKNFAASDGNFFNHRWTCVCRIGFENLVKKETKCD